MTVLSKQELQSWVDASPFIKFMGLEVISANSQTMEISARAPMRAEFERGVGSGQWHGGPIAALIDTVGDMALLMMLSRGLPTIDFRVDYLRPAINTALHATARVRRSGNKIGTVDVDVFDDNHKIVAIGRACYLTSLN